jgi:hypothetical protein
VVLQGSEFDRFMGKNSLVQWDFLGTGEHGFGSQVHERGPPYVFQ